MEASPYLSSCVTKINKESGKCSRFEYAVANCQGWRTTQEDTHLIIADIERNTSIFAVFDGHNGPEVAKFVAQYLPKHLLKNLNYRRGNIERGIREAFMALDELLLTKEANDVLLQYRDKDFKPAIPEDISQSYPLAYFTGCTAVVLLIKNDIYYCANIGDSRCIVGRPGVGDSGGHLVLAHQLSKDHKPDLTEERLRVEKAGGTVINGRINRGIDVSRSFGDHWYKRNQKLNSKQQMIIAWPHTTVEKIHDEDKFIVLICDGIWNVMDNQQLIEFISKCLATSTGDQSQSLPLAKICEAIIRQILPTNTMPKLGIAGKDNMTIMIIRKLPIMDQQNSNISSSSSVSIHKTSFCANSSINSSSDKRPQQNQKSVISKIQFSQDIVRHL